MTPVLLLRMTLKEQRAFSIAGPSWESMHRALDLLGQRPEVGRVVTGAVALEDIGRAMDDLLEGRGGVKVLVAPAAASASTEPAHSG